MKDDTKNISSMENYFYEILNIIDQCVQKKEGIIIHCEWGASRSATIVIGYVMQNMKYSFEKAYMFVKKIKANYYT